MESHHLDWLIVGGESGPGARPCNVEWIRSIVRQGREAGVPTFVKQLGAQPRGWCPSLMLGPPMIVPLRTDACDLYEAGEPRCDGRCTFLVDRKGGDPSEWPEDLRVREWPIQEAGR